ncbi:MAG: CHAP domain-containing protein [Bacilli bacterium]|nr:CHAP domain-containing protein [Bacilli bacterium]MDD4076838.1 CHAP domain-containing protein [Bacilli bacterium]MDD4388698.1 CHAP domain-containing protein [Bacilli bacterium]
MKKLWILIYICLFIVFIGCNYPKDETKQSISFSAEEIFLSLSETVDLPIDIIGYDSDDIEFVVSNPEVLTLNFIRIEPLAVGVTTISATVKEKSDINISIRVFVQRDFIAKPQITTSYPIMKVGQKSKLLFANQRLVGAVIDCFDWENSNDDIAVFDENLTIKALKEGTTTITATLRSNPEIKNSFNLKVVSGIAYRDTGKPVVFLKTEDDKAGVKVGEDLQILIDEENINLDDFYWKTINNKIARIGENGRLMGCAPGVAEVYVYSKADKDIYGKIYIEVAGTTKVDYGAKLVTAAEKELGYREKSDGYTKYGFWYGTYYGSYFTNLHWCAMFVTWCANEAGISTDILPPFANVGDGKQNYKHKNIYQLRENYIPKAGDVIFFLRDGAGHTGIVTGCDGERVYTIEGNTSDMVARRSYPLDYHTIDGYGTPNYPADIPEE